MNEDMNKVIHILVVFICFLPSSFASNFGSGQPPKCGQPEVVVISVPLFIELGNQEWVHSWLYGADKNGLPDFNRPLDEFYFNVQAPILENDEQSREIGVGFLHTSCNSADGPRKVLTYPVYILVTRVVEAKKELSSDVEFFLFGQGDQLMPRVRLYNDTGLLLDERQVLPFYGKRLVTNIPEMFEIDSPTEGYLIQIISPVKNPTRIGIVGQSHVRSRVAH